MNESTIRPDTFAAPIVFPADSLGRLPIGIPPDNLLNREQHVEKKDIELTVSFPTEFESGDVLRLTLGEGADEHDIGDEVPLVGYRPGETVKILLRAGDRPVDPSEDRHVVPINYRVYYRSSGTGFERGPAGQSFVTDIVRPGDNSLAPLAFDPMVDQGVTPETLIDDGVGGRYLPATVKGYIRQMPGDWVQGRIDDSDELLSDLRELTDADIGNDVLLHFPEDVLRRVDGGAHEFSYLIADRAGNISMVADVRKLDIRLDDRMGMLFAPQIPLFADDGVIGDADARAPVHVDIPTYARVRAGDRIVIDWGGTLLPPVTIDDPGASPVVISVPVSYGTLQRDPPRYTVDVSYTVFRGDDEKTSPPLRDVLVDLSLPGGPGGLDQGIFPEANDNNAINREAAESEGGTPFVIPVYANQRLGDVIHMSFVKYPNQTGSGEPVEATRYEAEHTVRDDDFDKPFERFSIPTEYLMMPAGSKLAHSARASYSVTAGSIHVESKSTFVLIDVR